MTSNELNNMKNDLNNSNCKYTSDFIKSYPALSTLIASSIIISTTTLFSSKARKVIFPAIKYVGKQQLKLFAGIGILSVATYVANKDICLDEKIQNDKN